MNSPLQKGQELESRSIYRKDLRKGSESLTWMLEGTSLQSQLVTTGGGDCSFKYSNIKFQGKFKNQGNMTPPKKQ